MTNPVIDTNAVVSSPEEARRVFVSVNGLLKHFGKTNVLDGVDFELAKGSVTAIVGPNASGKTTSIKCLLGLVRPDEGTIVFDGEIVRIGDVEYRRRMGYMPQAARFPEHLTGREIFAMLHAVRHANEENVDEGLLKQFELEAELDKPVRTLSGGTKQKINAAAAFLFRPDLVVLDEPTAGLDPVAASILKEKIESFVQDGGTVLLTSHILSEIEQLADALVFLVEGNVRFSGTLEAMEARTGERRLDRAIISLMKEEKA